jgi:hypothetical protein
VAVLPAWTPILRGYSGGLLEFCTQQIKLSQEIVASWLERYMLRHWDDPAPLAQQISEHFGSEASYDRFRTHGRPIRIEELRQLQGLKAMALEDDQQLQDAVLSIYHALDLTFRGPAIKVVENHLGRRKVRAIQPLVLQAAPGAQSGP